MSLLKYFTVKTKECNQTSATSEPQQHPVAEIIETGVESDTAVIAEPEETTGKVK